MSGYRVGVVNPQQERAPSILGSVMEMAGRRREGERVHPYRTPEPLF